MKSKEDVSIIEDAFERKGKEIYRKNVGIALINKERKIFVGKRFGHSFPISWQMPQGGMGQNEEEEDTLIREIREELGLLPNTFEVIQKSQHYYYYVIPPEMRNSVWNNIYAGQKQRWFLLNFIGQDTDINIQTEFPEFEIWKWATPEEVLSSIIFFKKDIYSKLLTEFDLI